MPVIRVACAECGQEMAESKAEYDLESEDYFCPECYDSVFLLAELKQKKEALMLKRAHLSLNIAELDEKIKKIESKKKPV